MTTKAEFFDRIRAEMARTPGRAPSALAARPVRPREGLDVLRRELGIEPEAETKALYQDILRQNPGSAVTMAIEVAHADTPRLFHTRNPFASGGVYEDPATGASTSPPAACRASRWSSSARRATRARRPGRAP